VKLFLAAGGMLTVCAGLEHPSASTEHIPPAAYYTGETGLLFGFENQYTHRRAVLMQEQRFTATSRCMQDCKCVNVL